MRQTITFKIEVEHPTPLKPEGEIRRAKVGELIWHHEEGIVTSPNSLTHLVVFPEETAK